MKRVSAIGLVLAVSLVAGGTRSVAANDGHAFEQMKSLVGEWKGTWMPQSNPVEARFYLTGDGSALVEDMKVNSPMSTVYHLDGDELRLTHYCSAGNQPRMKATSVSADGRTIEFELVDVTNLSKTGPRYTHKAKVSLIDEDHAAITYISLRLDGREVSGTAELTRVKGAGAPHETKKTGILIPSQCQPKEGNTKPKGSTDAWPVPHTTECALREACIESGYGLWVVDTFFRFDERGQQMALNYFKTTKRTSYNKVEVTGDFSGEVVAVEEIKPVCE